jgi:hypothetical protein
MEQLQERLPLQKTRSNDLRPLKNTRNDAKGRYVLNPLFLCVVPRG